ncbi:dipeptidase [Caldinitratiruptor microaerophilus]|uniref:Peptidase M20 n=1 Tax=Caldinitratiruptor microaerophilus TaxID=671077 RepID=A0AA35CIE0_9FIRM|nr:dipeptidase [Caldinitratiruptor microaerophilus]BDG59597.1 peptidase M20 [Caldinitratiruptor microaerophilus]
MTGYRLHIDRNWDRYVGELLDFLAIPSVSALPQHAPDVARAADWVAARMRAAGIENVQVLPTGGHPVVYGNWLHAPGTPTVLVYGHFDTQPADPLELWHHPPFSPHRDSDRVYARGASDDKGSMLIPILAAEALLRTEGRLPLNVKFLFEGQEEIGSPQLGALIAARRDLLRCDLVVNADGGQESEDQPALCIASRGLCAVQVDVRGPASDLHSGVHGGAVQNPIHALVRILDSLRGPDGVIRVSGFYDRVRPLSDEERVQIATVPFRDEDYMAELGVPALFGEAGYSTLERRWARPTLEVNGIWGGFQGEGVKTVLPAEAHAKITCRLVPDQDPAEVQELIARHVEAHTPPGVRVAVRRLEGLARPYRIPPEHPANRIAHGVLEAVYGRPPVYVRTGATIPVLAMFFSLLGVHTLTFGFGLPDENIHAPNEFFRLSSFRRGLEAYGLLFERLAGLPTG